MNIEPIKIRVSKVRRVNPVAETLSDTQYHQRIKYSKKSYQKKKIRQESFKKYY